MPLVSIIVPIYNKELCLRRSLDSILRQTFEDYEVLLINDGSTDNSINIAMEYQKKDRRVKCYSQENKGVSTSRNRGIDLADGKYISFLDADDKWNERFLEFMIRDIKKKNVCYCGHFYFKNEKKVKSKMKFLTGDILESYFKNVTTPNTNSWLIRKEYIRKFDIKFPNKLNWGEDMSFFSKVLFHDQNIMCSKKFLTEYYMSEANNLSENNLNKINKDIFWMNLVKKYIIENESNKIRKKKILNVIDSYRIPAAIIYRIHLNLEVISKNEDYKVIRNYQTYMDKIEISNGMRSIKLLAYKYHIFRKLKKEIKK